MIGKQRCERLVLAVPLAILLVFTAQTTRAFLMTATDSLVSTFVPPAAPSEVFVPVTVDKTVNNIGDSSIGPEGFTIVLESVDTGNKTALKTDRNGQAVLNLTFTEADIDRTFRYNLYEVNDGRENVIYDQTIHRLTAAVSRQEDRLTVTVRNDGQVLDEVKVSFVNTYHGGRNPSPPTGDKSAVAPWLILLAVSGMALVRIGIRRRARR